MGPGKGDVVYLMTRRPTPASCYFNNVLGPMWKNKMAVMLCPIPTPGVFGWLTAPAHFQGFEAFYLQGEGEQDIGLGQLVLTLLAHVDDGSVVAPFEFLQLEFPTLGHRHALQVGHEQVDRGLELLNVHVLHFFGYELRKFAFLAKNKKKINNQTQITQKVHTPESHL